MTTPALSFDQITCTFLSPDKPGQRYTAVQNTTLDIQAGEFVSVVGPTGCGKSTLLNLAAGLLQPSSGQVRVFGEPLVGINRRAGYMFQADALMPWRTGIDNVVAGLEFRGVARSEIREVVGHYLDRTGLSPVQVDREDSRRRTGTPTDAGRISPPLDALDRRLCQGHVEERGSGPPLRKI
mgnify:CR=1 FL=1